MSKYKFISAILAITLLWQNLLWGYGSPVLRALAVAERKADKEKDDIGITFSEKFWKKFGISHALGSAFFLISLFTNVFLLTKIKSVEKVMKEHVLLFLLGIPTLSYFVGFSIPWILHLIKRPNKLNSIGNNNLSYCEDGRSHEPQLGNKFQNGFGELLAAAI